MAEKLFNDMHRLNVFRMGDGMEVLLINSEHVRSVIDMNTAIELMTEAFIHLYGKESSVPLRWLVENPEKDVTLFFKPAFDKTLGRFSVKFLTQNEKNPPRGIPAISGVIMLMDAVTGRIVAIIDGTYITALRTGAVGGLATSLFSGEGSKKFALFGCGKQGQSQLEAALTVRDLESVYLFDNDEELARKLISGRQDQTNARLVYATDLEALQEVDIITTATPSREPLFRLEHLKPGVHINAIGSYKPSMQELDPGVIENASLFVDEKEACISEAGDIVQPLNDGIISEDHIKAELGEVLTGKHPGRVSEDEITVFKSVGIAVQDLFVANAVYEKLVK